MQIVTLKVGTAATGRDYSSFAAAWAATPSDLVAADIQVVIEIYPDSEFVVAASTTLKGKNTDANHTITIRPAVGQGFADNPNVTTNALRYNPANGVAFRCNNTSLFSLEQPWVTVKGLQVKQVITDQYNSTPGFSINTLNSVIENCIVESNNENPYANHVGCIAGVVRNVLVVSSSTGAGGFYVNSSNALVENCTAVRPAGPGTATKPAFGNSTSGGTIRNCVSVGFAQFSSGSFNGSNNATDRGTISFGTNNITSLSATNSFVSVATDGTHDLRLKAGSPLIDTGTTPSSGNLMTVSGNRQMGTSADIGVWEYPSSVQAPIATVTSISITNQTVVISGTTIGTPTSGTASLVPNAIAYNSAVAQGPVAVSLSSGSFTVTFNTVKAGKYDVSLSFANSAYTVAGINPLGAVDIVGPKALSLVQDAVTDAQVLTIHGTVEKATSGTLVVPASVSNPNVANQTQSVTVNTSVTPNTFTVSAALPAGSYDAPILTFTGPIGTSLPQAGTSSVVVIGPRALSVVQDPLDGQVLTIHGTVEKATSGQLNVPAAATNPNGAIEQIASVTVNTSVTPNTFTVSVPLPAGNYDAPILTFSNYLGPSQPQSGTSPVSIMSFNGSPQAPMPTGTITPDTTSPAMTGDLVVTDISATGFTVSWQAATDDFGVAYYEVSTDDTTYTSVGNVLTYTNSSATPATTYNVSVRAVDTASNRAASLITTVVTLAGPDVSAPVMVGTIAVSDVTSTGCVISWVAAIDNVGAVGYEYSVNSDSYVDAGKNLTATLSGLSPNTSNSVLLRTYDAAGNRSLPISATFKTASYASFTGFTPSVSRTIAVKATSPVFTGGKWWTLTDAKKPRGLKDPDAIIDITFDWFDWLQDIGSPTVSDVTFTLNGLSSAGTFSDGTKTTVFVSGGTAGTAAAISCKIKTFTNPSRIDERTVYIDIAEE
jgi:hypothetical protein